MGLILRNTTINLALTKSTILVLRGQNALVIRTNTRER